MIIRNMFPPPALIPCFYFENRSDDGKLWKKLNDEQSEKK